MSHTAAGTTSRILAMVAIVSGGVSLPLYWKFFPDSMYFAFFLGLIGVVLSVVALLRARKDKTEGRGLALAAIVISMLSFGLMATHLLLFTVAFAAF